MGRIKEEMMKIFTVKEMQEIKGMHLACMFRGGKLTSIDITNIPTVGLEQPNIPSTITLKGGDTDERQEHSPRVLALQGN